jgi:hypothetical protein
VPVSLPVALFLPLLVSGPASAETRTGWGAFAFPCFSYTSNTGFGYGAMALLVNHGPQGSGDEPYLAGITAQYAATTLGYQDDFLQLDFPALLGTGLRWNVEVGYEAWNAAAFFGEGNFLPRFPEASTPDRFYDYALRSLRGRTTLRVPIPGPLELFGTYAIRMAEVDPYTGSLLTLEHPVGLGGGTTSEAGFGVVMDTRDREPSPHQGVFSDLSASVATPLIGSTWSWVGVDWSDRRWVPLDQERRLIFANRLTFDGRFGQVPFYEEAKLGGLTPVSIGGDSTLRGFPTGRFRGDAVALLDTELRWTFLDLGVFGLHCEVSAVPFLDAGRVLVFEEEPDDWWHVHANGGLGGRLELNETFVARADVGFGVEEYVPGGSSSGRIVPGRVVRDWVVNLTAVSGQPF